MIVIFVLSVILILLIKAFCYTALAVCYSRGFRYAEIYYWVMLHFTLCHCHLASHARFYLFKFFLWFSLWNKEPISAIGLFNEEKGGTKISKSVITSISLDCISIHVESVIWGLHLHEILIEVVHLRLNIQSLS